mgnify:CR=1 FL=1
MCDLFEGELHRFRGCEPDPAAVEFLVAASELLGLWPQILIARTDDATLGGAVEAEWRRSIADGLRRLSLGLADRVFVSQMQPHLARVRDQLGALPEWPQRLEIAGSRPRDRLVRWLLKPYLDPLIERWAQQHTLWRAIMTEMLAGILVIDQAGRDPGTAVRPALENKGGYDS